MHNRSISSTRWEEVQISCTDDHNLIAALIVFQLPKNKEIALHSFSLPSTGQRTGWECERKKGLSAHFLLKGSNKHTELPGGTPFMAKPQQLGIASRTIC